MKGVTLEEDGVALFPDAPTLRGLKHIEELCEAKRQGYEACLIFVIQMKGVAYFTPNKKMQPAFSDALQKAEKVGVSLLALDCQVTKNSMSISSEVAIRL